MAEARQALDDGGEELDMVVNLSKVLSGDWDYVRGDLAAVIELTHAARPEGQGDLRELLPRRTSTRSGSARSAASWAPTG